MKFSISSSFNPCGTNIEPMQLVKKHFVLDLDIGFGWLIVQKSYLLFFQFQKAYILPEIYPNISLSYSLLKSSIWTSFFNSNNASEETFLNNAYVLGTTKNNKHGIIEKRTTVSIFGCYTTEEENQFYVNAHHCVMLS